MARLFEGNSGTSSYNAAEGKFNEVDSTVDPTTGYRNIPFDYGSEADFKQKVDLSLAGNMMDCGECHVGGGMMEYIPYKDALPQTDDYANRVPLRSISTEGIYGFGGDPLAQGLVTKDNYTAFNYFIDNYDVDGDGDENEVQYMDYTKTGVMEMDCFMCHLPGYKYEARRAVLRKGKIDATRAIGAGFATENTALVWLDKNDPAVLGGAPEVPEGYGNTVIYDNSLFTIDQNNYLRISPEWMHENLATTPDSTNCANCHMNEFSVDWKKRGDHWAPEGQYDYQYEVHYSLGCMGCHQRQGTVDQPGSEAFDSVFGGPYPEMAAGSLGHDPAKGDSQYSGLYNMNDNAAFKGCVDCHVKGVADGSTFAAPNPDYAHKAAGLMAKVAQGNTADGVAKINHIDMMHCSACHSRKINSYAWDNTGNPLIDATGGDHEKRLTDHENPYVIKQDMTDQTSLAWYKGKIHRVSPSATMFWRDKNDMPESATGTGLDANEDGRPHGMDALLMTQVLATNNANGWGSITEDNHGDVRPIDFATRISALKSDVETWTGGGDFGTGTAAIKFSIFHVNFMNQHGVSPAYQAFGANGCADCHDAGAEFYQGGLDTTGTANTMTYATGTTQRVPFTKVNGFSQPTDWHPMQLDKFGARSIAIQVSTAATTCDDDRDGGTPDVDCMTTRPVDRSENMYEGTFMGAADFADSYTSSAPIVFSGFEKGWQLIVQVEDESDGSVSEYLKMISTNVADVAGLLGNLTAQFKDDTFGFSVVAADVVGIADGISVVAAPGYNVRLKAGNAASFQLTHAAYKNTPWSGVCGGSYAGRTEWTAYLNGITAADTGIGVDPVAVVSSIPATVEVGTAATLVADESAQPVTPCGGSYSYNWSVNDGGADVAGASAVRTFPFPGYFDVLLEVTDEEGKVAQVHTAIEVVEPVVAGPAEDISLLADNGTGAVQTVIFSNLTDAHTKANIAWGDGTTTSVYTSAETFNLDHTFAVGRRQVAVGGFYSYDVSITLINGRSVGATNTVTILIAE